MFLNKKQESAIEFCITIFESRGLRVCYPDLETYHGRVHMSGIRWTAVNREENASGHILLTKWDKKLKVIIWLPKNPDDDSMSAIDSYLIINPEKTHLTLPYGQGQLSLHKIDPQMFMTREEMRDYLG